MNELYCTTTALHRLATKTINGKPFCEPCAKRVTAQLETGIKFEDCIPESGQPRIGLLVSKGELDPSSINDCLNRIEKLEAQLPDGMKDCTIVFRQCSEGHAWLTATNWVDSGCPTCRIEAVLADLSDMKGRAIAAEGSRDPWRARALNAENIVAAAKDVLAVRGNGWEDSSIPAYMTRPFNTLADLIRAYDAREK